MSRIICLTPVKNEEWILDKFLKATSEWADIIIILDQQSTDNSREIALSYDKVRLHYNDSTAYNELQRQELLLSIAREYGPDNLLFALDADEFLSSDFTNTQDWRLILNGTRGDTFGIKWLNLMPRLTQGWLGGSFSKLILWDDGSLHTGSRIHSQRLPTQNARLVKNIEDFYLFHLQYVKWERMRSKQRYYQGLEVILYPDKHPIDIYRKYHHMDTVADQLIPVSKSSYRWLDKHGIDFSEIMDSEPFWFDIELTRLIQKYGEEKFRRLDIWDLSKVSDLSHDITDPRNLIDRMILVWLKKSQRFSKGGINKRIENIVRYKLWTDNLTD